MGAITFSLDPTLVRLLVDEMAFEVFVETGTYQGTTVEDVKGLFKQIISVESSETYYQEAVSRFKDEASVALVHGDSGEALAELMPGLKRKATLFWLDAHWCADENTAGVSSQCPLLRELEAIGRLNKKSVILIDDARFFLAPPGKPHDYAQWPALTEVLQGLRTLSPAHELIVVNDVIVYYPPILREALRAFAHGQGVDWLSVADQSREYRTLLQELKIKEVALNEINTAAQERLLRLQQIEKDLISKDEVIQDRSNQVAAKDEVIQTQHQALVDKDEMIVAKEAVIQAKDNELAAKVGELASKDEVIVGKEEVIQTQHQALVDKDEMIVAKEAVIQAKDNELAAKVGELASKDEVIVGKEEVIQTQHQALVDKDEMIVAKEAVIQAKDNELAAKVGELASKDEVIVGKEEVIQTQHQALVDKDEMIVAKEAVIQAKDNELAAKVGELASKDEVIVGKEEVIQTQHQALVDKDEMIVAKEAVIQAKDNELAAKVGELASKDEVIVGKEALIQAREEELAAMVSELTSKDEVIIAKEEMLQGKDSELAAKDKVIESKDAAIKAREEELATMVSELASKDEVIEGKEALIQAREEELAATVSELASKDEAIEELAAKVSELVLKDEVIEALAATVSELASKDEVIESKDAIIRAKDEQVAAKEGMMMAKVVLIQAKDQELEAKGNELAAKGEVIIHKDRELDAKEAVIQDQYKELVAKEEVLQQLETFRHTSLRYWIVYRFGGFLKGMGRAAFSRFHRPREAVKAAFRPRLGVLDQHPPAPLQVPQRYHTATCKIDPPPKISVVTPSYNHAAFLERTIQSVLNQPYPNLEYIVQDGGSTDETGEILERYRAQCSHVESRKDRGQGHAINLGFEHATGEIMAWLNSDDLFLPGALPYVANYFARHPEVDVVYGHRVLIDEHDQEIGRWILPAHDDEILNWADYVPQETMFWRRRIWEEVGGIDESFRFALDWDLLLRFQAAGARIVRLPRFLGAFRIYAEQKTSDWMADVGEKEMTRLRKRANDREVSWQEINESIHPYLRRSTYLHLLYKAGLRRF